MKIQDAEVNEDDGAENDENEEVEHDDSDHGMSQPKHSDHLSDSELDQDEVMCAASCSGHLTGDNCSIAASQMWTVICLAKLIHSC